jgi:dolichyl-phosphate beta-glucosyltransferase
VYCSLIIPAFNEESRIGATLRVVLAYFERQPYDAEVIVVDDGSTDRTRDVVAAISLPGNTPLRCLPLDRNQGKGAAVKAGMAAATGEYRVFYDADGSTPITELEKLWPAFEKGAAVVIGSRSLPGSEVAVRQQWYRESMGKVFNGFLRVLGLTQFPDTQCGFKGFTAAACEILFPRQTIGHFSFDVELLAIAQTHGLPIAQVPVRWVNEPKSRVDPLRDSARMFFDMLLIRLRSLRGRYR